MSDINISYGGQAVIGGVLIQSPKGWSLGIRDKDDNLHRYYEPRIPLVRRNKFWAAPFILSEVLAHLLIQCMLGLRQLHCRKKYILNLKMKMKVYYQRLLLTQC